MESIRTLARWQIAQMKRPYTKEVIGEYLVLAVPNQAQYNPALDDYEQSFRPKWRICESSPYPEGTFDAQPELLNKLLDRYAEWHKVRYI